MNRTAVAIAVASLSSMPAAHAADKTPTPLYEVLGSPENWTINASFRLRLEGIDDQFRPLPAAGSDIFLSLRTSLFAEYHRSRVRIGVELIDSRGYFEKANSTVSISEINALELSQAYVVVDLGGNPANRITAGRFTMDDGSRRLVARNQFRNTTNAFTGVRIDWQDRSKDKLLLFWTMPHMRLPADTAGIQDNAVEWDRESTALQFFGGSYTKAGVLGASLEAYGFGLLERDAPGYPTRNRRLFTPGLRFYRTPKAGAFDFDLEGAYQAGHARASTAASDVRDLKVSAYFFHVELGHSFSGSWSPRLALQYDRASGDSADPASYTRFDTLFGARRGDYGPTSLYGAVARANISSPAVRLEVKPDTRTDAFIAWRPLWLANGSDSFSGTGVRDSTGNSSRFAGNQIEARLRYWLIPRIARGELGAAYLAKGRFLRDAPNAPGSGDTAYGYADLTFSL